MASRRPVGAITQYNPGEYQDSTGAFFTGTSLDNAVYQADNAAAFEVAMGRGPKTAPAPTPAPPPPPPSVSNPVSGIGYIANPTNPSGPATPPSTGYTAPLGGTLTVPPTANTTTPSLIAGTQNTPVRNPLITPIGAVTPNAYAGGYGEIAGFDRAKLADPNQPFNNQGKYTPEVRLLSQAVGATGAGANASGLQAVVDWINQNGGKASVAGNGMIDFLTDSQGPLDVQFDEGGPAGRWQMLQPWLDAPSGGAGGGAGGSAGGDTNTILSGGTTAATAPSGAYVTPEGTWIIQQLAPPSGTNGGDWIDNRNQHWTLVNGQPKKAGAAGPSPTPTPTPTPTPNPTPNPVPRGGGLVGGTTGPGAPLNWDVNQVGQDALSQLISSGIAGLITSGGSTPYMTSIADQLQEMISSGGGFNTERFNTRFEGLRDKNTLAQRSMLADARDSLAAQGLIDSGEVGAVVGRIGERLAPEFSQGVTDAYLAESEAADTRVMQSLQLATGLSEAGATAMLGAIGAGTQRQGVLANIALATLAQNADWQKFLANYNLTVDQINEQIQSGRLSAIIPLLQQFLQLATISAGGHV